MIQEWYEYAISIKKRTDNKLKKPLGFMEYFILVLLSIPLLKFNIWYWLILAISYCLSLFYNAREKDNYAKVLFDIGIALIVMGMEISSMVVIYGTNQISLIFCTIIGVVFYEILLFVNVKKKSYSTWSATKSQKGIWLALGGVLSGAGLGRFLIRKNNDSLLFFLLSIFNAMLFVIAISFLQRYVVYKIINNKFTTKN